MGIFSATKEMVAASDHPFTRAIEPGNRLYRSVDTIPVYLHLVLSRNNQGV